jgi:hypothetical protein
LAKGFLACKSLLEALGFILELVLGVACALKVTRVCVGCDNGYAWVLALFEIEMGQAAALPCVYRQTYQRKFRNH